MRFPRAAIRSRPRCLALWLAIGAAIAPFDARAEGGDAEAGRVSFAPCQACHGARGEGLPALNAPNLAGQTGSYLVRQLQNFRAGLRGAVASDTEGAQMRAAAAALTDLQIRDLVAHLETLPEPTTPVRVTGDLRNGSNYYQMKCNACHGPRAEGNALLDAPRLAGISDAYLLRQLDGFVNGLRGTHAEDRPGRQMTLMARTLPDEQTRRDVIAYVRSLAQTSPAPTSEKRP